MDKTDLTPLMAQVVEAFVSQNRITAADLPVLIATVHQSFAAAICQPTLEAAEIKKPSPARIRQSIQPDRIVSFEDGRSYKMLKRHLARLGLTPVAYRQKWGLPADYPMTSAGYSAARSAVAKAAGLGKAFAGSRPASRAPARVAGAPTAARPKVKRDRKPRSVADETTG